MSTDLYGNARLLPCAAVIGMLPLFATACVAYTGNIYAGLWYPIIFTVMTAVIGFLFLKETKDVDIGKT